MNAILISPKRKFYAGTVSVKKNINQYEYKKK